MVSSLGGAIVGYLFGVLTQTLTWWHEGRVKRQVQAREDAAQEAALREAHLTARVTALENALIDAGSALFRAAAAAEKVEIGDSPAAHAELSDAVAAASSAVHRVYVATRDASMREQIEHLLFSMATARGPRRADSVGLVAAARELAVGVGAEIDRLQPLPAEGGQRGCRLI